MNNNQIDNTSYYQLPCGKYLEDFIDRLNLRFAEGNVLKYLWRAGKKDGESVDKDMAKAMHYAQRAAKVAGISLSDELLFIDGLIESAKNWDGK